VGCILDTVEAPNDTVWSETLEITLAPDRFNIFYDEELSSGRMVGIILNQGIWKDIHYLQWRPLDGQWSNILFSNKNTGNNMYVYIPGTTDSVLFRGFHIKSSRVDDVVYNDTTFSNQLAVTLDDTPIDITIERALWNSYVRKTSYYYKYVFDTVTTLASYDNGSTWDTIKTGAINSPDTLIIDRDGEVLIKTELVDSLLPTYSHIDTINHKAIMIEETGTSLRWAQPEPSLIRGVKIYEESETGQWELLQNYSDSMPEYSVSDGDSYYNVKYGTGTYYVELELVDGTSLLSDTVDFYRFYSMPKLGKRYGSHTMEYVEIETYYNLYSRTSGKMYLERSDDGGETYTAITSIGISEPSYGDAQVSIYDRTAVPGTYTYRLYCKVFKESLSPDSIKTDYYYMDSVVYNPEPTAPSTPLLQPTDGALLIQTGTIPHTGGTLELWGGLSSEEMTLIATVDSSGDTISYETTAQGEYRFALRCEIKEMFSEFSDTLSVTLPAEPAGVNPLWIGERWATGNSKSLVWDPELLDIEDLYVSVWLYKGDVSIQEMGRTIINDGTLSVKVTYDAEDGDDYTIRVKGAAKEISSMPFIVYNN